MHSASIRDRPCTIDIYSVSLQDALPFLGRLGAGGGRGVGLDLRAGDRCGACGLGCGGLDGTLGDGESPGHEQHRRDRQQCQGNDHGVDRLGPALGVHPLILSTGSATVWTTVGSNPGTRLTALALTVIVASAAVRDPVMLTCDRPTVEVARKDCAAEVPAPTVPRSAAAARAPSWARSEEHTSELQSRENLVCRLLRGKNI